MDRCCLEYAVGISAIAKDAQLGDKYVEHDANATNKFFAAEGLCSETDYGFDVGRYMVSRFGPDFAKRRKPNWHDGFPTLLRAADRKHMHRVYVAGCQVVHGTVVGVRVMNAVDASEKPGREAAALQLLLGQLARYCACTLCVINLIYGNLWCPQKEQCTKDYNRIAGPIGKGVEALLRQSNGLFPEELRT